MAPAGDPHALLAQGALPDAARAFAASLAPGARGRFTLQVLVACAPENVQKAVSAVPAQELLVLPVNVKGRACYRLCWGVYDSRPAAEAALRSLPSYFRQGGASPRLSPLAELAPLNARRRLLVPAALVALAGTAGADSVVLKSGRVIEADQAWFEGSELHYRRNGTVYAVPRSLVERVDTADGSAALEDPDTRSSRERLAAGDPAEALRFARLALFRQPASVPALQALAAAQIALGQVARAREAASTALGLEPGNARSLELLGDALVESGDFASAREPYRLSLEVADEPRVRKKLDALVTSAASVSSARFRIRYDGAADEPLGLAVLQVLDSAWEEYERRLGFAPSLPVTVVLQTATTFRDTTRAPDWAAAWNDGTIRVPVAGVDRPTPGLVRVLRHELAHSFVAARAGASCPTWLHEGLAQWLEGGDPEREDPGLARLARESRLPRLDSLERPFVGMSEAAATVAYAQSLSAVAQLLRSGGEAGVRRLVEALGRGLPAKEALPEALGLSYGELQRAWEAHLRAAGGKPSPASYGTKRSRSGPVSRILSPPPRPADSRQGCAAGDDHSSSPEVTRGVQQPTRGPRPGRPQTPLYSVLLRVGFSLPAMSPRRRCALTAPFHPCHPRGFPREFGGVFSVALSLGSPPLAVNQHAALWSPDFPPRPKTPPRRSPGPLREHLVRVAACLRRPSPG